VVLKKDEKNKTQELLQSVQSDKDKALTEQYDCETQISNIENKIQTYEKDNVQLQCFISTEIKVLQQRTVKMLNQ
jgi:hypothetical protein